MIPLLTTRLIFTASQSQYSARPQQQHHTGDYGRTWPFSVRQADDQTLEMNELGDAAHTTESKTRKITVVNVT